MLKLLVAYFLSLLFAFHLYAEVQAADKQVTVIQFISNPQEEINALKSKPNLTLEEMRELNKKEKILMEIQGELLNSLEKVDYEPEIVIRSTPKDIQNFAAEQKKHNLKLNTESLQIYTNN